MRPLPRLPFGALGFALFGALLVLVGASQDEIHAALALDLARAGLLVSSVMSGIGLGLIFGGPLVDRFPRRPLFCASAGATGLALMTLDASQGYWTVFVQLGIAGTGAGLYETILNAAAIEHYEQRSVRMVALLHSFASVGAMLTPFGIDWLVAGSGTSDWTLAFRITGGAHLALAAASWTTPLGSPRRARAALGPADSARILTRPLLLLCVAAFAYVGVESAITGLAIPYAKGALALPADRGRGAISLFWLGLLAGRLAFALRSAEVDDARVATWMSGIAGGALVVGVGSGWHAVEAVFGAVGFALGGIFPLLVALAGRRTPQAPATGVAVVAGLGSAGGFAIPWLTGALGDAAGIAVAMGSLALLCAVLGAAAMLAERTRRAAREKASPEPAA